MNAQSCKITYAIDNKLYQFSTLNSTKFRFGKNEILSSKETDSLYFQPWYEHGFKEISWLNPTEFDFLKDGLKDCVGDIVKNELGLFNIKNFQLEKYHHFVTDEESHHKVVGRTRDLFDKDFKFSIYKYIPRLEDFLKLKLTDYSNSLKLKMHVIVRIVRPHCVDFNPPHKDMYEAYDALGFIPKFINFWIPIAGVTSKSSLPLVKGSHLINEQEILRTFEGGDMEGNSYRVRLLKSWDGQNFLERSKVQYGEVLVFSSHLIHGLAINEEADTTRVALEYRLFENAPMPRYNYKNVI